MLHRPLHALQLPAGPRLVRALAAALDGTGPAVLPLSPDLPDKQLRRVLAELRPHALTTANADGAGSATTALPGGVGVDPGTAMVIVTSGTTGDPKGVELAGAALTESARASLSRIGAGAADRWYACLPPDHIAGAQVLVRSIVAGTEPVYPAEPRGFDPQAAVTSGANHLPVVPTMLTRMLEAGADLSALSTVLLGGAAIPPGLVARAREAGGRVVTTYGMTETCGGCVYDGMPLAGVDVDVDSDGRVRLAGQVLFSGYRLRPDLTAVTLDGPWFITSDLGQWVDGRLRVTGRADDVIITGGYNVVPGEVAAVLAEHPAVADVAVVGRPDEEWGERVTAVVVPADRDAPPNLGQLREHVRRGAPAHCAPRELDVVEWLPLLRSGKPDRDRLRRGPGSSTRAKWETIEARRRCT